MLTARAYTLRQKSRLAISLSWVAGYTNVVTLTYCGVMVSHATGNITHLGQHIAQIRFDQAWFMLFLVGLFLVGALLSGVAIQMSQRRHMRSIFIAPIAIQAALLAGVSALFSLHAFQLVDFDYRMSTGMLYWTCGLSSIAMGLQNATITSISGSAVRTTHVTGVLTDIGTSLVSLWFWVRDKTTGEIPNRQGVLRWKRVMFALRRHDDARQVALLTTIIGSFLFGVIAGFVAVQQLPGVGLLPPVVFLLFMVVVDWREPIADLKEVDRLTDAELGSLGISSTLLPADVGIWRIAPQMVGLRHHAPDFAAWMSEVPRHTRIAILSISHGVHIDGDAALDLLSTWNKLNESGKHLILANVKPEHFAMFQLQGLTDLIDRADFCTDLEFAIARALSLQGRRTGK